MNRNDQRMQELEAVFVYISKGIQPTALTIESIEQVEREVGSPLPEDYREFLRDSGCYSLYAFFPCETYVGGGYNSISVFYGLPPKELSGNYDSTFDVVQTYHGLNEYKPKELLPIGTIPVVIKFVYSGSD